jgi:hypothetical protein
LDDEKKSGKRVAEKSDAESPPAKVSKVCPREFKKKRSHAKKDYVKL